MINIDLHAKLIYGREVIQSSGIDQKASVFASRLKINKGDRVCIYAYNRPEWVYSFFGIWKKGGIPVPVDFMSTPEEISYIINDCEPAYILTTQDRTENVQEALKKARHKPEILQFEDLTEGKDIPLGDIKTSPEDTAVILYTSGTTGEPKGVMLTFKNLLSNINGLKATNIANHSDSTLAILPFHHSYPLMVSMLFPLHIGATVVFLKTLSPEEILKNLQEHKITVLVGVPRLYQLFHRKITEEINKNPLAKILLFFSRKVGSLKLGRLIFRKVHTTFGGNIKYFVSGGAKLDEEVARDFWAMGFKVIEGYGLTETSPIVSFNPPDRVKIGSAGKPIKGIQVKTEDGEILVKGDNVMKGYWKKPEETSKVIKNGWLYTGDLGFIDTDGYLFITGRKKEIIVLPSGKNINPEELEQKILKISDLVKEAAVIYKNGKLTAVIYPDFEKLTQLGVVNIEETIRWNVIDKLNRKLPDYKRINSFVIVKKELPKTRLGKIRRFMLESFLEEKKTFEEIKQPDFKEYRILKNYLEKITGRPVSPQNHIEIDLGMDSLEKLELLTFIEKSFGVSISENELAKFPTVEKLSYHIKDKRKKAEEAPPPDWSEILSSIKKVDIYHTEKPLLFLKKVLQPVFKTYFKLKIHGTENIPDGNFILAPNHQSFLDGFLIIASLPDDVLKNTYFLAEETYFPEGFIREVGKRFHVLTVNINKDLKGSLSKTAYLLKNGKNVVIFPEGARTRDGRLLPFKKSFAILSKELGVPVVPVVIKGAFEAFPIGSKFPKPKRISLYFLKPIEPDDRGIEAIVEETYKTIKDTLESG